MSSNDFVKRCWKIDVDIMINDWGEILNVLDEKVSYISSVNNNFIDQTIAEALLISLNASLEKTLINLVEPIEKKAKHPFSKCLKLKNTNGKISKLAGIKEYIEDNSLIKLDDDLFNDILAINTIRNKLIHADGKLTRKQLDENERINSFALVDDLFEETDIFIIGVDMKLLIKSFKTIKLFLLSICEQDIFNI